MDNLLSTLKRIIAEIEDTPEQLDGALIGYIAMLARNAVKDYEGSK